jgi:site-specific DNA-cytosine methylase
MQPTFLIVDLFCGFGGTTTGFEQAMLAGNKVAQ